MGHMHGTLPSYPSISYQSMSEEPERWYCQPGICYFRLLEWGTSSEAQVTLKADLIPIIYKYQGLAIRAAHANAG